MTTQPLPTSLTMPTMFPANPLWGDQRTINYRENTNYTISFFTEKPALAPYLPKSIVVPDEPLVMVTYGACRGVVEMADDGYNLVSVTVAARWEGEEETQEGDLSLVIWESTFPPVTIGRDMVGYPKLVAEVPDLRMGDGRWSWRVSENGVCFLEGQLWDLEPLGDDAVAALKEAGVSDFGSGGLHMTYRVVPGPNYHDEPVVAAVYGVVHHDDPKEAWTCKGSLTWHEVTPQACYFFYGIVEALRKLPVVRYGECLITRGPHLIELGKSRPLR